MQIRLKLTLQFVAIVAIIILLASLSIYFFSADFRQEGFYDRLRNKATNTAKLLIEVEEVDAGLLTKIEKNNPASLPNEKIIIFNYRNEIIFSSPDAGVLQYDQKLLDRIRLNESIQYSQGEYEVLGFLFTDRFDRFVVIAAATDIFGYRKLKNLRTILLLVFGGSILLTLILGWFYAGRALRPISSIVERVDEITATNLDLRLDEGNGQDEIARLANRFNSMLERLEIYFKVQKNFIANASHELRTPLTIIAGQLEVVLMNERTPEEYKKTLESVLEDIRGLNTVSNRLLLLAQASSQMVTSDFEPVRMDEIIWQARAELIKRHPSYEINIAFSESIDDEGKLTIKGNSQLLKTAMSNLIENGCKYSDLNTVDLTIDFIKSSLILIVKDKGIGIPETDLKHIFEPFHRGKNAITRKGHGIGLSLVDRIVKLHGGNIVVISGINEGTTFKITFPQH